MSYCNIFRMRLTILPIKSVGLTFEEFTENETLIRAFARSLKIIGEATKKLPHGFKEKYPDIKWKAMAGMRDKLIL